MSLKKVFTRKKKSQTSKKIAINPLYKFDYTGIIHSSQNETVPFFGSEVSDTLFFEGSNDLKEFAFLFLGEGCNFYPYMNKRIQKTNSLLMIDESKKNKYEGNYQFFGLPERKAEESTFLLGKKWVNNNKAQILQKLEKTINEVSVVFVFPGNDGFVLGMLIELLHIIKEKGKTCVLVLEEPPKDDNLSEEVHLLSFISFLVNDEKVNFPFILIDHNKLISTNSSQDYEQLLPKIRDRIINVIIDLLISSKSKTDFYSFDFTDFLNILKDVKGPCSLLSYEIYDEVTDYSVLLETESNAITTRFTETPLRGLVSIQAEKNNLSVSNYRIMRKRYSNKDVFFTSFGRESKGTIVRGIFTYLTIPQEVLDSYTIFNNVIVKEFDENKEEISSLPLERYELLLEKERYLIENKFQEEPNEQAEKKEN